MIRTVDTGQWTLNPMQVLSKDAKLLLHYLKYNDHCHSTGIYFITPVTIQNETGINPDELPKLMAELAQYGEVIWWQDQDRVWVKNFVKEQCISSKFLIGIDHKLGLVDPELLKHFLEYNADIYKKWNIVHSNSSAPSEGKGKYGRGKKKE